MIKHLWFICIIFFVSGDFVLVVQEINADWWLVQTADGRSTGLVPAPYLNKLPHRNQEIEELEEPGKVL